MNLNSNSRNSSLSQTMSLWLVLMTICCLAMRQIDAGKGKGGRQGHIIVQNEVKGHAVPIYMPIPIPIPMPMGPAPSTGGGQKYGAGLSHHHNSHQDNGNEGEGEVKKIYLLQPMPKLQPQPQLKGGGYMGPAMQTHIHLPGSMLPNQQSYGPAKFRLSPMAYTKNHHQQQQQQQQQQNNNHHHHNQVGDFGQFDYQSGGGAGMVEKRDVVKSSHEVKVLPIVVIPPIAPMAPMPPIHISSGGGNNQSPRMSPQFNNYLVAGGSQERRKMRQISGHHIDDGCANNNHHHHHHDQNQDILSSSYGGSAGGSLFRDNPARFRPRSRQQRYSPSSQVNKLRDYDYTGDADYDSNIASSSIRNSDNYYRNHHHHQTTPSRASASSHRRQPMAHRLWRSANNRGSFSSNYGEPRFNSIRDIIDHQMSLTANFNENDVDQVDLRDDYRAQAPAPTGGGDNLESLANDNNYYDQQQHFNHNYNQNRGQQTKAASRQASGRQQPTSFSPTNEDSSSSLQLERDTPTTITTASGSMSRQRAQDLSSLYYDRGEQPIDLSPTFTHHHRTNDQRTVDGELQQLTSGSGGPIRPSGASLYRTSKFQGDERDLFDDDDVWQFDSIKSVKHLDANETMTKITSNDRAKKVEKSKILRLGNATINDDKNSTLQAIGI